MQQKEQIMSNLDLLMETIIEWLRTDIKYKNNLINGNFEQPKETQEENPVIDRFSVKNQEIVFKAINECLQAHEQAGNPGVRRGEIMHYARVNFNIKNTKNWS